MTTTNKISADIDAANDLIRVLQPELEKFGTFEYNVLSKGITTPVIILEISFARLTTNVFSKYIIETIVLNTSNDYFFSIKSFDVNGYKDTKQTINIVI
jgi:hypothetical protein